jgi:sugar lactone lactonase YvrE
MEPLCAVRDRIGESPLWSVAEQALYWVDIDGRRIHRLAWASRQARTWTLQERVGSIALHRDGGLVAAMETAIRHVRLGESGDIATRVLAPAPWSAARRPAMRFNDGRCDRAGRFWVTGMVRDVALGDPSGALYRLDDQGLSGPLVDGLVTGNGLAFSPDGATMMLSDSHPDVRRVWAFDVDAAGQLSRRREFADLSALPGRPDGAAVDTAGGYWVCANDAGLVHRFHADGRHDRSIAVPVAKPAMCAFGGPALDVLFVTSIRPEDGSGGDPALAGAVFFGRPGETGIAEVPFGGAAAVSG